MEAYLPEWILGKNNEINAKWKTEEFAALRDPVEAANAIVGELLLSCVNTDGKQEVCIGMIQECEAYGVRDAACHGYNYHKTQRNRAMFSTGGIAYVYRCYGIHNLLNIVCSEEGDPTCVLIRSLKPIYGIGNMCRRRKLTNVDKLCKGPGCLTVAMGIDDFFNGIDLTKLDISLDRNLLLLHTSSTSLNPYPLLIPIWTPRIGLGCVGPDAKLPWRVILHFRATKKRRKNDVNKTDSKFVRFKPQMTA